jgi:hypothetical protein
VSSYIFSPPELPGGVVKWACIGNLEPVPIDAIKIFQVVLGCSSHVHLARTFMEDDTFCTWRWLRDFKYAPSWVRKIVCEDKSRVAVTEIARVSYIWVSSENWSNSEPNYVSRHNGCCLGRASRCKSASTTSYVCIGDIVLRRHFGKFRCHAIITVAWCNISKKRFGYISETRIARSMKGWYYLTYCHSPD